MRRAFWLLTIISLAAALPLWQGEFTVTNSGVSAVVNVTGESPLRIDIPSNADINGAEYANGTAVFNGSFSYSYSPQLIADTADGKLFLFVFSQPQEFEYSVTATAPVGDTIASSAPQARYETDGRRISARWAGTGREAQFSLRYSNPAGPVVQFVETDIPIVDKTIFLPGLILAFLLGYFLAAGFAAALLQRIRHITARMSDDEKNITGLLRDGPLEQSAIQQKLGFSKAKLSRTLREMEERKIVEKTPKGKTNLISLR